MIEEKETELFIITSLEHYDIKSNTFHMITRYIFNDYTKFYTKYYEIIELALVVVNAGFSRSESTFQSFVSER